MNFPFTTDAPWSAHQQRLLRRVLPTRQPKQWFLSNNGPRVCQRSPATHGSL